MTPPRISVIGNMTRLRKRSYGTGISSPADEHAGFDHVLDRYAMAAEVFLERKALIRGVSQPELKLYCRVETAVGKYPRARAPSREASVVSRIWPEFNYIVQGFAALLARLIFARNLRQRQPGLGRKPLHRFRKAPPSVSIKKSEMLPFLPEEKSNHAIFWSLTKNDGVFSLLNGDSPFHSCPALRSFTRRPTISETGSRARSSSRNCGGESHGESEF